jgi:hypothetical protein
MSIGDVDADWANPGATERAEMRRAAAAVDRYQFAIVSPGSNPARLSLVELSPG